ncbi:zinc finger and SCAN domain-containing protein 12-like isoform X1 [Ruditapes philippinarum]|uniref:zinc finger and SCAN domain-containing protein 12-like isoform X1 n=1 Tax=Ruditapes philippinarum TaxID=129788 RepID=UPI00295B9B68|nr:zinc finger and SCAN domain-containing protein 12-like isoform X1 [Ruditapes philippinarum]
MDSYLMMLYVSIEQEKAMKKLFSDNGWKYCKPDILHLTDKLGGVHTSDLAEKSTETMHAKITSPPKTTKASVTSPQRPATRSQKSRMIEENTEHYDDLDTPTEKEECEDVVDDGDLNDYMEHGDEDDDYIDDDKEMKKITRQLTKSPDSNLSFTEREEFTAKLDGTEDIDPEDLTIMFDEEVNSTDDDGSESNTDNVKVGRTTEPTVKVLSATRVNVKRKKKAKLDRNTNPLQYQCGICKEKYLDKRDLNKHLTDKECVGDNDEIGKIVSEAGENEVDLNADDESMFDSALLTDTDKISSDPDLMNPDDQFDDLESSKNDSLSIEGNNKMENKGEKNFYKCNKCDLAYKMAHSLKTHQITKHGMKFDETFECSVCHILYGSEYILSLHKLDKHGLSGDPANSMQCEECEMICDDFEVYRLHKKREHNIMVFTEVNRKYVCKTCGKAYTRPDSLKYHCEVIHLGTKLRKQKPRPTERKHICDFCGKAFLRRTNLSEHISVKHTKTAKRHTCDQCGETFLRPYALEYHKNKVHLNNKPYKCDKCHKTYFTPINLRQHKEICLKEEEEKEACPYCDKRFIHKRNLSMHVEAIHSQSPLTCECGYVIKWRSSIAKHRRKCRLLLGKKGEQNVSKVGNKVQNVHIKVEKEEAGDSDSIKDVSGLDIVNADSAVDTGFMTISTDSGEQVISNDVAQALRDQGLLIDRTVAGTLKMEEGKTVFEEDPSVQSVYYVIMKE